MPSNTKKNNTSRNSTNHKYEVAEELGVEIGPDASARNNGRVGGQITKDLVNKGKQKC
ncbi:MAG: alpha/beta-type small acid-soluble spore protein [Clostridium sp.]|nr:MAG: alpha/beta-type small acid-soluble spore protein [Clostridium sp.]